MWIGLVCAAAVGGPADGAAGQGEVNLYSYRQPQLIDPILDEFTRETGIKVNVVFIEKGMVERLKAEGAGSPADAVLTVDVGRLHDMVEADLLQPIRSDVLERNVPAEYRHPGGLWYGLSARARVLVVSRDRVGPGEVTSYEGLADPRLKGRLCFRSGKHDYNVSLIAAMIARSGEDAARQWLEGVRANLARKPQGNDRTQSRAIAEGACDVALTNTYYLALMAANEKEPEQKRWAEAVKVVFPDQRGHGTHVNISGAAVLKNAPRRANAVRLLEFLSGERAQKLYAERNYEHPVKPGVAVHPLIAALGRFKADSLDLTEIARNRARAAKLVDETRFDLGAGGS
jgi:iron(III) transport system substrate-binding protein